MRRVFSNLTTSCTVVVVLTTSGPGFDSRWQPNIFNSVLFKKSVKEREYI